MSLRKKLALLLFTSSALAQAHNLCTEKHCAKINRMLYDFCSRAAMVGEFFMVLGPQGEPCFCRCELYTPNQPTPRPVPLEQPTE